MFPKKEYQFFIGIDMAKDTFVVNAWSDKATPTYDNNLAGFEMLAKAYGSKLNQALVVIEVTGRYEMSLIRFLLERGVAVHRAAPLQVKNFIRSWGQKGKTDQIDAQALALYGKERHAHLALFESVSAEDSQLDALVKRRADLVEMQTKEKNRLKAPDNDFIKSSVERALEFIKKELEEIEAQMQALIEADPMLGEKIKTAKTVPGIGKICANNLIISVPELGRIDRRKIASLVGLAPHPRDSGKKEGLRRTSKGREAVKKTLFMAAMAASKSKSFLGEYYRKKIGEGKKPMVVMVALMRKILVILNASIRAVIKSTTTEACLGTTPYGGKQ